jgi:hypothetical protein
MPSDLDCAQPIPAQAPALTPAQLADLVGKLERENINLRRQVAWFQRQIFGQKSEKALLMLLPAALSFVPGLPQAEVGLVQQAVYGLVMVLLMIYRPGGIVGVGRRRVSTKGAQ